MRPKGIQSQTCMSATGPTECGTRIFGMAAWILRLFFHPPSGARALVWFYWFLVVLAVLAGALFVILDFPFVKAQYTGLTTGIVGFVVALLIGWLIQKYLYGYIGDAARYLTPDVGNVTQRAAIRKDARDLLVKLHASGRYDRIIVVGHSLGSVIAYDVVNRLWDEYRDRFGGGLRLHDVKTGNFKKNDSRKKDGNKKGRDTAIGVLKSCIEKKFTDSESQPALREVERVAYRLREMTADDLDRPATLRDFWTAQALLWDEQRRIGNDWLVSDLITLGSPLAHASWLTRLGGDNLHARFKSREFGRCPPLNNVWERRRGDTDQTPEHEALADYPEKLDWIRVIIPSAVFSVVRWTNLYFPGDVIGGEVHRAFGPAVKDIAVRRSAGSALKSWILSRLPTSHTKYWSEWDETSVQSDSETPIAVRAIQKALHLE